MAGQELVTPLVSQDRFEREVIRGSVSLERFRVNAVVDPGLRIRGARGRMLARIRDRTSFERTRLVTHG